MFVVARAVVCILFALTVTACRPDPNSPRQYELQGQVLAVRADANEVVIKHGDIKGFMPGMTMPFKVRDRALLRGSAAGDLVTAHLMVAPGEAWIASLTKTGSAPVAEVVAPSPAAFVIPLKAGDPVPNADLTDQRGGSVSLERMRGQAVVVTFIYTRCPLPQFCPLMDRRFAEVQKIVTADKTLAGRARLLSVSFDPDHDTPAVLKAHADRLGADPAIWTFATAPRDVVDRLAAEFGVNVIREADRTVTHNLRTAVIAPNGDAVSVYNGSEWTTTQVVDDLRRALSEQ